MGSSKAEKRFVIWKNYSQDISSEVLDFKIKGKIAAPTSSISLSLNLITLFSS
jgi:hypothetical protein